MINLDIIAHPVRYLFFTGKGGVGKTSLSCASAIALCERGLKVLLVSTDPASNLDEMLGTSLSDSPTPVLAVSGLSAMNIDPEVAAESYRGRVLAQLTNSTETERQTVREQLSGACTTEIAAFDEFVGLLADDHPEFDHIIFDTAPTGHTLRLLSLPKAWTGFLADNDRGASCLGPHSGLKMQEERFKEALAALGDKKQTTIIIVARPDGGALREAARTSQELLELGLANQFLALNGRFHAQSAADPVARAFEFDQRTAIDSMPASLSTLPRAEFPLLSFDMVGISALRALFGLTGSAGPQAGGETLQPVATLPPFSDLVDELAAGKRGLIMVMGKGGVGKTTVAAAIAVGLAKRGHPIHLTTTDPAAHLAFVLNETIPGLTVDRIDPEAETARYIEKVMSTKGRDLDDEGKALLREDLASPCTEEVAVFHAFSRVVAQARDAFVVIDTAPTGHTLLLLDATGAYHRQMTRQIPATSAGHMITPLMRLQDPEYTKIMLVALPETTPISEASALQEDLRRARIEPYAWVVNRSMAQTATTDPILASRKTAEAAQLRRVTDLAVRAYVLGYQTTAPVGAEALARLSV